VPIANENRLVVPDALGTGKDHIEVARGEALAAGVAILPKLTTAGAAVEIRQMALWCL
jgi:hypothetical protein